MNFFFCFWIQSIFPLMINRFFSGLCVCFCWLYSFIIIITMVWNIFFLVFAHLLQRSKFAPCVCVCFLQNKFRYRFDCCIDNFCIFFAVVFIITIIITFHCEKTKMKMITNDYQRLINDISNWSNNNEEKKIQEMIANSLLQLIIIIIIISILCVCVCVIYRIYIFSWLRELIFETLFFVVVVGSFWNTSIIFFFSLPKKIFFFFCLYHMMCVWFQWFIGILSWHIVNINFPFFSHSFDDSCTKKKRKIFFYHISFLFAVYSESRTSNRIVSLCLWHIFLLLKFVIIIINPGIRISVIDISENTSSEFGLYLGIDPYLTVMYFFCLCHCY